LITVPNHQLAGILDYIKSNHEAKKELNLATIEKPRVEKKV
jgi:hypothetical protein